MDKLIIAAGFLLIVYALWQTIQKARGRAKSSCCGTAEAVSAKKVEDTDVSHYPYRYRLSIDGMMCSNCAKNVENTLNSMNGVWGKVNLGKKKRMFSQNTQSVKRVLLMLCSTRLIH